MYVFSNIPTSLHRRLSNVDGLRGLAALLVLFQHLSEYYCAIAPPADRAAQLLSWIFLTYIDLGKVGVVTFFAISGFVVPFSFNEQTRIIGFAVSRFFRLYPAYWLSLVLAVLFILCSAGAGPRAIHILANVTMLQEALHAPDIVPVYWTLFIEIVFYGLCVLLFRIRCLHSPRAILVAISAAVFVSAVGSIIRADGRAEVPVGLPLYLAIMFFGTLVRMATLGRDPVARKLSWVILPIILVAVPAVWMTAYDDHSHRETVLADIAAFYVAIGLFLYCVARGAFMARPLVHAGALSYSIYLFHPLSLDLARLLAARAGWPLSGLVLVLVSISLTLGLSHVVFNLVEKPFIRRGRQVSTWISQALAAKSAQAVTSPAGSERRASH